GRAIRVGVPPRLRRHAHSWAGAAALLGGAPPAPPRRRMPPWLAAMRPHQWTKNLLVFLPALAAHSTDARDWALAVLAFAAFSLVASGVYVLNDLLDLQVDRAHPRKRFRPLAAGTLSLWHGTALAPALLAGGGLLGLLFGSGLFAALLFLYFGLTLAYSLALKRQLVIDICTLAGLYALRVLAGAAVTGIAPSPWLLVFSLFFFLALAAVKRQAELVATAGTGVESGGGGGGRAYVAADLPIVTGMALSSGYVAVLVMALFISAPTTAALYGEPALLWGICPVLLYWISRAVMLAHRGGMHDDPVVFAFRDRVSLGCGVTVLILLLAATLA
ncbi:MAG: UbiA family prenyltransferase, partial [Pseudomonadota bacterium]